MFAQALDSLSEQPANVNRADPEHLRHLFPFQTLHMSQHHNRAHLIGKLFQCHGNGVWQINMMVRRLNGLAGRKITCSRTLPLHPVVPADPPAFIDHNLLEPGFQNLRIRIQQADAMLMRFQQRMLADFLGSLAVSNQSMGKTEKQTTVLRDLLCEQTRPVGFTMQCRLSSLCSTGTPLSPH